MTRNGLGHLLRLGRKFDADGGQRGGLPSTRSKASIGKLASMPPSTQVTVPPSKCSLVDVSPGPGTVTSEGLVWTVTGSKKNGIDMEARTARTTSSVLGVSP